MNQMMKHIKILKKKVSILQKELRKVAQELAKAESFKIEEQNRWKKLLKTQKRMGK